MPKPMVDEEYLINKVDSYSASLIKINKTKDLALLKVKIKPRTLNDLAKTFWDMGEYR